MIENYIINQCIGEKIPVTLFLMNGFQLKGILGGADKEVVFMESDGRQYMIYKHAISTIELRRGVDFDR
jgi:host factor-I protein